ncbi:MAG: GAF domain-containing protein, partial [Proteobacteria bacterium]
MYAPIPINETDRLQALHRYSILDTPPEPAFDRLTALAVRHFHVPIAALTFLDSNRQWFKSCLGTPLRQTERKHSFCSYTILSNEIMVIPDALRDPRFNDSPFVNGPAHIRSYAGVPLRTPSGYNLGSFCIIDIKPRRFSSAQKKLLED